MGSSESHKNRNIQVIYSQYDQFSKSTTHFLASEFYILWYFMAIYLPCHFFRRGFFVLNKWKHYMISLFACTELIIPVLELHYSVQGLWNICLKFIAKQYRFLISKGTTRHIVYLVYHLNVNLQLLLWLLCFWLVPFYFSRLFLWNLTSTVIIVNSLLCSIWIWVSE